MVFKKNKKNDSYDDILLQNLDESLSDLRAARNRFMFASDEKEITATIFEINALTVHYSNILKEIRERGLKREPFYYLKKENQCVK